MADSLWSLREQVRQIKPNLPVELADQLLNKHIQSVVKKRSWSDLLRVGSIAIPGEYSTGTISIASGNIVTGSGTGWPMDDAVNTTLSEATSDAPGFCKLKPASMTEINAGDYLLLDAGTATQEIVVVTYAGPAFLLANCTYAHAASATVQKSNLANQQLSLPTNQVVTVQAVLSDSDPQTLQIDQQFGGVAIVGGTYWISLRYARISATAYRLIDAVDPVAGIQIGTGKTYEWLNYHDPQRTTTEDPLEMVSMPPNPGGVMQWEIWPAENAPRVLQVLYVDGWPRLVSDTDRSPFFINDEIFVGLAQADALCTRNIPREGKQDPYYDPSAGNIFRAQAREDLETAIQMDEGRYLKAMQSWSQQFRGALGNTAYESNHLPGWPSDYE